MWSLVEQHSINLFSFQHIQMRCSDIYFFLLPSMYLSHRNCMARVSLNCSVGQRMNGKLLLFTKGKKSSPQKDKKCLKIFFTAHRSPLYSLFFFLFLSFSCLLALQLSPNDNRPTTNQKKISNLYQASDIMSHWFWYEIGKKTQRIYSMATHSTDFEHKREEE